MHQWQKMPEKSILLLGPRQTGKSTLVDEIHDAAFAVASELCKRGIYAQLTLGNRKRTDLLVESDEAMFRVQVKSKQGPTFPAAKGIVGRDIFLVFVDFQGNKPLERPSFFVLDPSDWTALVTRELVDKGLVAQGKVRISPDGVPTYSDGYVGMNVKAEHLEPYRERWEKIERRAAGRG